MANLDDLFSKRDKKKKTTTSKSKFSTLDANEFAKQLEATSSSRADDDLEYPQDGSDRFISMDAKDTLDEEWKPFDSEDNRDYSGLRIIQWKVEDRESEYGGGNEDGDKKSTFVWGANSGAKNEDGSPADKDEKPTDDTAADTEEKEKPAAQESSPSAERSTDKETSAVESKDAAPAAAAGGAYVPPALRRAMQGGAGGAPAAAAPVPAKAPESSASTSGAAPAPYLPPHLRGKAGGGDSGLTSSSSAIPSTSVNFNRNRPNKSQPNIMDTMEFPTLDSAGVAEGAPEKAVNGGDKFEMPKKSGRIEPKTNDSSINLDNKFKALSTNN